MDTLAAIPGKQNQWPARRYKSRSVSMKVLLASILALGALSVAANAAPVKLSKAQMDKVVAGKLTTTTTQVNGGGQEPNGAANGVPTTTTTTNPAGHAPPGAN